VTRCGSRLGRTAIERRYRLLPYLYTLFREASVTGLPVVRPVFFADAVDPGLRREDVAFLLGADLLVVPNVFENRETAPTPNLPGSIWRTISLVGENSCVTSPPGVTVGDQHRRLNRCSTARGSPPPSPKRTIP